MRQQKTGSFFFSSSAKDIFICIYVIITFLNTTTLGGLDFDQK